MVFHEITPRAIQEAFANPRQIDQRLVEAQETRRVLDRLVGYEVSPVLWRMIQPRLSAGRVQSVAVRLVVQREWERIRFRSAGYWDVAGTFGAESDRTLPFPATLIEVDGRRLATGRDFDASGTPGTDVLILDQTSAQDLASACSGAEISVRSVERKPYRTEPLSPLPHFDAATGGREEAGLLSIADHVGGAAALRAGVHHVHADRQHRPLRVGGDGGAFRDRAALRAGVSPIEATLIPGQGAQRPGGTRGDPSRRRAVP